MSRDVPLAMQAGPPRPAPDPDDSPPRRFALPPGAALSRQYLGDGGIPRRYVSTPERVARFERRADEEVAARAARRRLIAEISARNEAEEVSLLARSTPRLVEDDE